MKNNKTYKELYQQAILNLGGKEYATIEFSKKIALEIEKIKREKQPK